MWLIYAFAFMFLISLVNYIDEWLTLSSTTKTSAGIHERIGGVLLMSCFMTTVSLLGVYTFGPDIGLSPDALVFALLSSVSMMFSWAGYFYLFQKYSAHQVVPLFGLSSLWLLLIELSTGATITGMALAGIGLLITGAYLLDNGSLKLKAPSSLLMIMSGVSLAWAVTLFLVKLATVDGNAVPVFFWQMAGVLVCGIMLFALVRPFRAGFIGRVRSEGKKFIGPSLMNEACSQAAFLCSVLSVASAPLAVYFSASTGMGSLFLLGLFWLFPLHERNEVTPIQWIGVTGAAIGIALLELGR
jgi:uncharacterized membrane protein